MALLLSSCAASTEIQPQINSLAVAGKYDLAIKNLQNNEKSYGPRNRLLYLMDYGLLLHYAGRFEESSQTLEEAKRTYDSLYTVSLTKEFTTWLVNDSSAPYRGEDFERVLINVFEAVNYAASHNFEEALVEARDVDQVLKSINRQYPEGQKNVYKEDAFARLLMGILYEGEGSQENLNDAYISYRQALLTYENDYAEPYKLPVPQILKENILALSEWMGKAEFREIKNKFPGEKFVPLKKKKEEAEVYLVDYYGLSPMKYPFEIPLSLPGGIIARLAFPKYEPRGYEPREGILKAVVNSQLAYFANAENVEDIGMIARRNLENRQVRVVAKAALRSAGKYALERIEQENIERRHGRRGAYVFGYLSSLYNLISEQPDLRSWQTLPDRIRLARLVLDPGDYQIYFNDKDLGRVTLKSGEKRFFIVRTNAY